MSILYYWLYKILSKTRREEDPGFATTIVLGFMLYWNIITILKECFPIDYFSVSKAYAIFFGIAIAPVIFLPLYFFLYKRRFIIIERITEFTSKRYMIGKFFSYLYFIISVVTTFYFLLNH